MNNQETHLQRAKEEAKKKVEKHLERVCYKRNGWASIPMGDVVRLREDLDEIVTSTVVQTVEACEALVEKHDPNVRMDRKTSSAYWGNKLREELQSLKQTKDV